VRRGTQELTATVAVAGVAATWGCWWIFLRLIEAEGISPGWTLALVYGGSALLLVPLGLFRWRCWRPVALPVFAVGLAYSLPLAFWSHAVIHGNVVRVTLLFYLTPVWGTLAAVFMFAERLTFLRVAAIAFGLAGAVVVIGLEAGLPVPETQHEWMALAAGILFAFAAASSRRWPDVSGYDSCFPMFFGAGLLGIVFAGVFGNETAPDLAAAGRVLPLVVGLGLVLAIPSQILLFWAAARLDPGRVSTLILFDVLATTVSATILTNEPFGWREVVGCLFILAAGLASGVDQMWQTRAIAAAARPHAQRL
jgi:drug/metabolite transporter (DMT)-like permease